MGGDRAFMASFIEEFLADISTSIEKLDRLVDNDARQDAYRLMHTLKGTAATMGASRLSADALALEKVFKEGGNGIYDAGLRRQLQTSITDTIAAMRAEFAGG